MMNDDDIETIQHYRYISSFAVTKVITDAHVIANDDDSATNVSDTDTITGDAADAADDVATVDSVCFHRCYYYCYCC